MEHYKLYITVMHKHNITDIKLAPNAQLDVHYFFSLVSFFFFGKNRFNF